MEDKNWQSAGIDNLVMLLRMSDGFVCTILGKWVIGGQQAN